MIGYDKLGVVIHQPTFVQSIDDAIHLINPLSSGQRILFVHRIVI